MNVNKEAIHEAYLDINRELTSNGKKEEQAEKKVIKEEAKPAEKKEENKEAKKVENTE